MPIALLLIALGVNKLPHSIRELHTQAMTCLSRMYMRTGRPGWFDDTYSTGMTCLSRMYMRTGRPGQLHDTHST
jgi:hypothetical protein